MSLQETRIGSAAGTPVVHEPDLQADGHHARLRFPSESQRYRASRRLGITHTPIHHRADIDAVNRGIARLKAYVHRRDPLNPVDLARTLEWLLKQPRIEGQGGLALRLNVDKTWICKMLTILRLPEDMLAQVATLQLRRGRSSAHSLVRIARVGDPGHQQQLIDMLVAGASHRAILRRIDELTGKAIQTASRKRVVDAGDGYQFAVTRPGKVISILGILQAAANFLARIRAEAATIAMTNEGKTAKGPRLGRFKANGKPIDGAQEISGDGVRMDGRPSA
jgi:hypothetical protein